MKTIKDKEKMLLCSSSDNCPTPGTAEFWSSLYHALVTLATAALPLLIIPPTLVVATVRSCVHGHCCQVGHILPVHIPDLTKYFSMDCVRDIFKFV